MKPYQRFEFETPLLPGNGPVRIEGVCYRDPNDGFDIDSISYNGANILAVLHWLGDGSVNEIDKIYYLTCEHCRYLRTTWNEKPDITTDNCQNRDSPD
jgi:hypothetical protein